MTKVINDDHLFHHGVKGMKWGVRRYQNYDGTLIGSRPRTMKERLNDAYTKKVKGGDPTTNSIVKTIGSTNTKTGKRIEKNYNDKIKESDKKLEERQKQIKKEADEKYLKEVSEQNPIYYKSKTYSNEELQQKINRLRLEKAFRDAAVQDIKDGEHYVTYRKNHDEKDFNELLAEDIERDFRREIGREISKELLKKMAIGAAAAAV